MELTKAKEKISTQKLRGKKLSMIIKTACFNNENRDLVNWFKENNYFGDPLYVIQGIKKSNKWKLLDHEVLKYFKQRDKLVELSLCRTLRNKEVTLRDIQDTNINYVEALSVYGSADKALSKSAKTTASFLNELNLWERYYGKKIQYLFNNKVANKINYDQNLINMLFVGGKINEEKLSNIYTDLCSNLKSAIYLYLKNSFQEQDDFCKAMFITTCYPKVIDDNSIIENITMWGELEAAIFDRFFNLENGISLRSYSKSKLQNIYRKHGNNYVLVDLLDKKDLEWFLGFRLFQLELFTNKMSDLSKVKNNKLAAAYLNTLNDLGFITYEHGSKSFKWPDFESSFKSGNSYRNDDIYDEFDYKSPLKSIGYTVGKKGANQASRKKLLDEFYRGSSKVEKYTDSAWGSPRSSERLEKMVYHLYYQVINKRKLGHIDAVNDWQQDLKYLKKEYYNDQPSISFRFPEID